MPTIEREGLCIHYKKEGKGEAVLLLQGVGVPACGWKPQMDDLAKYHLVIAPDNRGLGRSSITKERLTIAQMASDALAILDHEGIESAHIVGHSMGGVIAQELALATPHRVKSLSLLCTFAKGKDGAALSLWKMWLGLRMYIGTRAMRRVAFMEMIMPPAHLAKEDTTLLATQFSEIFGRDLAEQPSILMRQVKALGASNCFSRLGELKNIPTWVVSGELDRVALPSSGEALAAAIGGTFEEWKDVAHGLPIRMAEQLNARLLQHFAAVSTGLSPLERE